MNSTSLTGTNFGPSHLDQMPNYWLGQSGCLGTH